MFFRKCKDSTINFLSKIFQNSFYQVHDVPPHAKYGGRNTVTLIPGDGVGPEMVTAVQDIFRYKYLCYCM